jgi:hypothetical protein
MAKQIRCSCHSSFMTLLICMYSIYNTMCGFLNHYIPARTMPINLMKNTKEAISLLFVQVSLIWLDWFRYHVCIFYLN